MSRAVLLLLGLGLNLALLAVRSELLASWTWLHPVAPPLTRIEALGDQTLASEARGAGPRAVAGPELLPLLEEALLRTAKAEQQAELTRLAALPQRIGPLQARSQQQREAVQRSALRLAQLLGAQRVGVILARKEALADDIGEGLVWRQAAMRVAP